MDNNIGAMNEWMLKTNAMENKMTMQIFEMMSVYLIFFINSAETNTASAKVKNK